MHSLKKILKTNPLQHILILLVSSLIAHQALATASARACFIEIERALRPPQKENQVWSKAPQNFSGQAKDLRIKRIRVNSTRTIVSQRTALLYVIAGTGKVQVNGRTYLIGSESAIQLPAREKMRVFGRGLELLWVENNSVSRRSEFLITSVKSERYSEYEKDSPVTTKFIFGFPGKSYGEFVIGLAKVEPGQTLPLHRHPGHHPELYIGLKGKGQMFLGSKIVDLVPGATVYVAGREFHGITATQPTEFLFIFSGRDFQKDIEYDFF